MYSKLYSKLFIKIYESMKNYSYTFIMLHPMGSDSSYFDEYIEYIKKNNKIYNKINFILPESPIMDVDYPNNKQYNVKSWFNYYTYNNNIDIIDEISVKDYNLACNSIITIINREATILGSYKRIFILGVSQGGTLLFNILNKLEKPLGGLFCIKSLYMYKYVKLTKNTCTPLYFYSGNKDEVYNLEFQQSCSKLLEKKYKVTWTIINDLNHHEKRIDEYKFVLDNMLLSI